LFGRQATYSWSLPNEAATTKKAVLLGALNADLTTSDELLISDVIKQLTGSSFYLVL
jgi:hypothetical protein